MRTAHILLFLLLCAGQAIGQTWKNAQSDKQGELTLHWFTSVPFIYEEQGKLKGIEYEMFELFRQYVKERYQIELTIKWQEAQSFNGIIESVQNSKNPNEVGVSAFSINEERKRIVQFSKPYFPDITVLVTSKGTPIAQSTDEMEQLLGNMEAVTIKGTSYESLLRSIRRNMNIPFVIKYIDSDQNILRNIAQSGNRFGFIDLPIYLMLIKDGGELIRQNYLTFTGTGYGFIFPSNSKWSEPFNEFLSDQSYRNKIIGIISKYLGEDLYQFMESMPQGDQMSTTLLTKEKELQLAMLNNANLELKQEQAVLNTLLYGFGIAVMFVVVMGAMYYSNLRSNRMLLKKNEQIARQEHNIRQINEQLMNRNAQLTLLNEEKNNLVKILAHDLRNPLSQITMLANMLQNDAIDKSENDQLLGQIGRGTDQMHKLIGKVLNQDVLDGQPIRVMHENVDITQLVDDLVGRYRSVAEAKRIELELSIGKTLPSIKSDHLLLTQVLDNLLSNAIKFSPANSKVQFSVEAQAAQVLFAIKDAGPGFTEKDKQLMFNRFQKLSARPTGGESSIGLGLSIVKTYVDQLKGEIWLESEVGKGSKFFVRV